ncbi:MAG: hypothetical protein K2L51_07675 [Clostridiales bacterium]|nr:hypothetical protein [Clostridiales bacterium]
MKVKVDLFAIGREPKPSKKSGKKHMLFMTTFGDSVPKDIDGLYEEVETADVWIPAVLADLFKPNVQISGEMEISAGSSGMFKKLTAFVWQGKRYVVDDNREVTIEDFEDTNDATPVVDGKGKINKV